MQVQQCEQVLGYVTLRQGGTATSRLKVATTANGLAHECSDAMLTAEQALYTSFFPQGRGFWNGCMKLSEYMKMRMDDLFGPFSRCSYYISGMYQIFTSVRLTLSSTEVIYERDIARYRREHETATLQDAIRHVLKHSVPSTVPGSSSWHSRNYQKLLAMIREYGHPSFFLTLTADEKENSSTRFEEVDVLEHIMTSCYGDGCGSSWTSLPTFCARLFHHRVWQHMDHHVLSGEEIYGKVLHYFIRYEHQRRGSLHAHIILWVEEADAERVGNEIVAAIPGVWDEEAQEYKSPKHFEEHNNEEVVRYYNLVMEKMQHTCLSTGCLKKDPDRCQYGYPFQPNVDTTKFDDNKDQWVYYRPREADKWTVPHHPVGLCLWGAHCCMLKCSTGNLARYLLKYATKCSPTGTLNITPDLVDNLGMEIPLDVTSIHSAMYGSRAVPAPESAWDMMGMKIVFFSPGDEATYISTVPPYKR